MTGGHTCYGRTTTVRGTTRHLPLPERQSPAAFTLSSVSSKSSSRVTMAAWMYCGSRTTDCGKNPHGSHLQALRIRGPASRQSPILWTTSLRCLLRGMTAALILYGSGTTDLGPRRHPTLHQAFLHPAHV